VRVRRHYRPLNLHQRRNWRTALLAGAVDHVDVEALTRDSDQLFAEALVRFRRGEQWWPDPAFERLHTKPEQDSRYDDDPWERPIKSYVETLSRVSVEDIARQALGFEAMARVGTADQRRITGVLASLGWKSGRDYKGCFFARAGEGDGVGD
jgi:predicted P-loop ATPase